MSSEGGVLGMDSPVRPSTPRTPGRNAINGLVEELCNKFGLEITPHDSTLSPAQQQGRPGYDLYSRIKYLYWQDRDSLYTELEAFKSDPEQDLGNLSAQRRTEYLLQRLSDTCWFAKERIKPTPPSTPTPRRTLPPDSFKHSPLINGYASKAQFNASSMPPSPLAKKSVLKPRDEYESSTRSRTLNSSRTLNTSFTDSAIGLAPDDALDLTQESAQYGPWLATQDLDDIDPHHQTSRPNVSNQVPQIAHLGSPPAPDKRRKSDENEYIDLDSRKTVSDTELLLDGKRKTSNRHHQIKALEKDRFGSDCPYFFDSSMPYAVSVERARYMKAGLTYEQAESVTTHADAKTLLATLGHSTFRHSPASIWDRSRVALANADENRNLVQNQRIHLNPKSDNNPLMQIEMQPIRKEARSNYLERHWGWDRFVYVTFPSLTRDLPKHLSGQQEALKLSFEDMIVQPTKFMGRIWCAFHTEDIVKKISGKRVIDNSRVREVTFFAMSGDGIDKPTSQAQFMDWMIPFAENAYQPVCKLYSRISLFLSRTIPTVQLRYNQIRWIEDIQADSEPENTQYDDPVFSNEDHYPRKQFNEPMTDGCARISVGLARKVCREGGIPGFPSTFQGRIGGYVKGTWAVSGPYDSSDPQDLREWIEIRPSQVKVSERPMDRDPVNSEDDRWTFNVVDWSKPPRCSDLHRDFLQLLEDRHVPRETLKNMIDERVEIPLQKWNDATQDPARFVLLRDELFGWSNDNRKTLDHGLPHTAAAKTRLLVDEAGFFMDDSLVLVEAVGRMQDHHLQQYRAQLRFTCPKSTIVVGVADPCRVVKPGTVHFSPSQPLVDQPTGEVVEGFAGQDILVSRHPSELNSDIQKIRCVYYPELGHIKDTVVMSTRGQIPLAAKLQGGDYDGDKFWLCADDRIVQPFKNAPVLEQFPIDYFGIKQEKRRLIDIVGKDQFKTDGHVKAWLRIVLPFACREKQLGRVTNYLKELAYHYNDVKHPAVKLMADLHGLIIDADKNGYKFDFGDFMAVRRKHKHVCPDDSKMRKLAYRENLEAAKFAFGDDSVSLRNAVHPGKERTYSRILDDVVFNILNPRFYRHLDKFHRTFVGPAEKISCDQDLTHVLTKVPQDLIDREQEAFGIKLKDAYEKWRLVWAILRSTSEFASDQAAKALKHCIDSYNAIRPTTNEFTWDISLGPNAPTVWDCFKVAVLAKHHYMQKKSFMLWVALDTVCFLKGLSRKGKDVIARAKAVKKPREPKDWARLDGGLASLALRDSDDELLLELGDEYFDELD